MESVAGSGRRLHPGARGACQRWPILATGSNGSRCGTRAISPACWTFRKTRRCFRPKPSGCGASCSRTDRSWRSSRDADVLLLGDSFSNIYSLESMGWGTSAGFAEQLSYSLRRPVDRLVQNDQGAFATRPVLQRDPEPARRQARGHLPVRRAGVDRSAIGKCSIFLRLVERCASTHLDAEALSRRGNLLFSLRLCGSASDYRERKPALYEPRSQLPIELATSTSVRTPTPVGPLGMKGLFSSAQAVPAMSR